MPRRYRNKRLGQSGINSNRRRSFIRLMAQVGPSAQQGGNGATVELFANRLEIPLE